ncbi:carbon-nitrogen hydrolase family protein [Micromonospora taraxaci]|uniref:carbon-nitrogen hydrolase family protein n=1 Tax=Micromonospora taraxaci TaxID=1316803 RepID=UPI0033FFF617
MSSQLAGITGVTGALRVGACQTPEILGDVDAALRCMEGFAREADQRGMQLLLFPECFLQGYLVQERHLDAYAMDLRSAPFGALLRRLDPIRQTLVFGMIERREGRYFNSAVVVGGGELLGIYRKVHLMPGESLFTAGEDYPTFDVEGMRFGINICSDTQVPAAAAAVAAQDAQLLLVPAQNMMRRTSALQWKDRHTPIRAARARESGLWLVSADVTGERGADRIGYGPTSIINPQGEVVAQVPEMTPGMATATVDCRKAPPGLEPVPRPRLA